MNVDSEKVVGEIPNTDGVHDIALANEFNKGFTSNGRAGTVTIFDLKTLAVTGSAQAGTNPDAIEYDPVSKRVFAMNGRSSTPPQLTPPQEMSPEQLRWRANLNCSGRRRWPHYVNVEDKSELWQIDSQKLTVTAHWPLATCQEPSGLAIDGRASPPLRRLRQQNDGGCGCGFRESNCHARDRRRRRRMRLRSRHRFRVRLEWPERNAKRDSRGLAR